MTDLQVFSSPAALSAAVGKFVANVADQATSQRGGFTLALSGGSLPGLVCPPLTQPPLRSQIDWSAWQVFWADERCVQLTDPDSNYRLAKELLFDHVPLTAAQIHPIDSARDTDAAAHAYQEDLLDHFAVKAGEWPRFDLILLGMGPDGHTASLFPNHPLLAETRRWVVPIYDSPKPPPNRITFTLPLINAARHVAFVITRANKAEKLQQARHAATTEVPVSLIRPTHGTLTWFVDDAAAALLG